MEVVHERNRAEARPLSGGGDIDEAVEHLVRSDVWIVEIRDVEIKLYGCAHLQNATRCVPASRRYGVNMEEDEARVRFATATVARMATVDIAARPPLPHLVPITFALLDRDTIVSAVDHKPKQTTALRRLDNIRADRRVSLLVDEYRDDWSALWWVRADGEARVVEPGQEPHLRERAIDALVRRYRQYARIRPEGDLVVVEVQRWVGWSAAR